MPCIVVSLGYVMPSSKPEKFFILKFKLIGAIADLNTEQF
jgi:hypothetical protein